MVKDNLLSEGMSEFHAGSQKSQLDKFLLPAPPQPTHLPLLASFSKAVLGTVSLRVAGTVNAGLILVCLR